MDLKRPNKMNISFRIGKVVDLGFKLISSGYGSLNLLLVRAISLFFRHLSGFIELTAKLAHF
jgi:hypothetical protein